MRTHEMTAKMGRGGGKVRVTSIALFSALAGCNAPWDESGGASEKASTTTANHLDLADLAEPEQPRNVMYSRSFAHGVPVAGPVAVQVVPTINTAHVVPKSGGGRAPSLTSRDKVARKLREHVAELTMAGRVDDVMSVIVMFRENVKIPRFPRLDAAMSRSESANTARMQRATLLVNAIIGQREPGYATKEAELLANYRARSLERFWLINAIRVELPASEIDRLSAREDVVSIDSVEGGSFMGPMAYSRSLLNSDPYFNLGTLTHGYIGVIDSGIIDSANHVLLSSHGQVDYMLDCVNGGTNCDSGMFFFPWDINHHGTPVASIIAANNAWGTAYRGVTDITLDTLKVGDFTFDGNAVIRAFQRAVAIGDWSANASFGGDCDEDSPSSAAADQAFDAGMVVIAAAGNYGPGWQTITCPGNARKVLAVGAIDVDDSYFGGTRTVLSSSSRGPALDGRVKPDLIAPTNVSAADSDSSVSTITFGGTSGATAHVTGAVTLWMNAVDGSSRLTEPGQFYSDFIALGGGAGGGTMFDSLSGAGLPRMMGNGYFYHAKTIVYDGVYLDFPIVVSSGVTSIDVAIWWPESIGGGHDDIDLSLVDPSGVTLASSLSGASIFEKVHWNTPQSGTWKVRVTGYSVASSRDVYWSAMIHQ